VTIFPPKSLTVAVIVADELPLHERLELLLLTVMKYGGPAVIFTISVADVPAHVAVIVELPVVVLVSVVEATPFDIATLSLASAPTFVENLTVPLVAGLPCASEQVAVMVDDVVEPPPLVT
jgi:hypothetical protein